MQTDGRTYITKLMVAFCSFAKAPTNSRVSVQHQPTACGCAEAVWFSARYEVTVSLLFHFYHCVKIVSWLITGLPSRRPGFDSRPFHVRFACDMSSKYFIFQHALSFYEYSVFTLILTFRRRNYFFFNFSTPCI